MFRFFLSVLLLTTPLAVLVYWLSGISGGFRIWEKLSPKTKKILNRIVIASMITGGGGTVALGTAFMHGCLTLKEVKQYAGEGFGIGKSSGKANSGNTYEKTIGGIKKQSKVHDLGKVSAPPPQYWNYLTREIQQTDRRAVQAAIDKAFSELNQTSPHVTIQGNMIWFSLPNQAISEKKVRSGPFCRITCAAHHGGEYDVETLPEACKANWIPPKAYSVPGWYALSDTVETTNPWPGPAQDGFESYRLYWSSVQSAARVVHKAYSLDIPHS